MQQALPSSEGEGLRSSPDTLDGSLHVHAGYQGIPNVVYAACLWLEDHAMGTEGLWRVAGNTSEAH